MSEEMLEGKLKARPFNFGDGVAPLEKGFKRLTENEIIKSSNIFITGLARAGTTSILQSLDSTGEFASLRYDYMPFILNPRIAGLYCRFFNNKNSTDTTSKNTAGTS